MVAGIVCCPSAHRKEAAEGAFLIGPWGEVGGGMVARSQLGICGVGSPLLAIWGMPAGVVCRLFALDPFRQLGPLIRIPS